MKRAMNLAVAFTYGPKSVAHERLNLSVASKSAPSLQISALRYDDIYGVN